MKNTINEVQSIETDEPYHPSESKLIGIIKKLRSPKAPGADEISNILVKKLPI